jgi:hypothetical protein
MADAFQRDDEVASSLLNPVSAANTAAATTGSGNWVDLSQYAGDVLVTLNVGAVTGSIAGKLQVGDDNTGANAVDITGATFSTLSAAGVANLSLNSDGTAKRYLGFVGTIVTGPALVSVTVSGVKKYN